MTTSLPKSAQIIQNKLTEHGLACKVVELSDAARTAQQAADALGCNVAQIAKSLIFKTKETHQVILVLCSGSNRVNEKTIEQRIGQQITKADASFTREVTGFAIGGIPPIGHATEIPYIFIDQDLLAFDTLWAAGGTPHTVFNIKPRDLVTITKGTIISVY